MARSLGTLTLDLILNLAGFKEGMDKAAREVERSAQKLNALKREGAGLKDALQTPFERFQAEVAKYTNLLATGAITQETFERAVRRSATAFDAANPELQQHNKLLAEGAALTKSLRTPQEQLTASLAKYDQLLKAGAIDQTTFNRAVAQAHATFKTSTTGASQFGAAVGKAKGVLLGLGVPLSLAAIAQGFKTAAFEAVQFGEDLGKAMEKTGLGAEAMSELAAVAKQSEVDLQTLSIALRNMQIVISDAIDPTSAAAKTLKELGLTVKDLEGLDADKRFELIAQRISEFRDEADRAALRLDVFKRAGDAIAPVMEGGARGIRDARDAIRELNGTTTGEAQAALDEAAKAADNLGTAYDALKRSMTAAIAPELADFLLGVTDIITGQGNEVLTLGDRWTAFWKGLQGGFLTGPITALRELGKAAREAREELGPIEITATPIGTRKRAPQDDSGKKAASEAAQARKAILDLITSLEQQTAVTGETEEATIRYRIAFGDLVDDFKKAGPAFEERKQQLIDAAAAADQFKAGEELRKANEQIAQQVIELQAARIELDQGAAAAFKYRAEHGELAKTLDLATDSQNELNDAILEGANAAANLELQQAITTFDGLIRSTEDATTAIIANKIAEEQGAVAAIRYRIAQGDLSDEAKALGISLGELQTRLESAVAEQEALTQAEADLDASESIIPSRTEAVKEYEAAIRGLNARLASGDIEQREFAAGVKIAEKNFKEATKAVDEMSVFAEQAAKNMQDAFADFLFDPFKDGLDGMINSFAETLRRMAAEVVAAKLADLFHFEDIFKGGGIFGGGGGGGILGGAAAALTPIAITAQKVPVPGVAAAAAGVGTAAESTAAATAFAAAITTAGTTAAAAFTGAGTAAATALTASGTTVASSIIAAGTTAAAAIGAAATAGAASGGLSEIPITATRLAEGGKVLGPGTATSDSIPAWLSAGEFVVKAEAVRKPGVQELLEKLNARGSVFKGFASGGYVYSPHQWNNTEQHFAAGGLVQMSATPVANPPQTVINQNLVINSPSGHVSRATEMQITAAAARGAKVADRRNN